MSDFASVVERTRRSFAAVSKLEAELARDPLSAATQINLMACKKIAQKNQEQLLSLVEIKGRFGDGFSRETITLGLNYEAEIRETKNTIYATEKVTSSYELISLKEIS